MATSTRYILNGTSPTIQPVAQIWEYPELGLNFDGSTSYARKKRVILDFGDCTLAQFKEWETYCGGSVNRVDILAPNALVFNQYNNVVLDITARPRVESVNVRGNWQITISDVLQA